MKLKAHRRAVQFYFIASLEHSSYWYHDSCNDSFTTTLSGEMQQNAISIRVHMACCQKLYDASPIVVQATDEICDHHYHWEQSKQL